MSDPRLQPWRGDAQDPKDPIIQFELGPMQNLVYLVVDWATGCAAWVDPQRDLAPPISFLKQYGLTLESILLTHTHHDHVAGLEPLLERHPDLPAFLHEADAFRLKTGANLKFLADGETFKVGSLQVRAFNMPGHSIGALTFEVPCPDGRTALLTGDTLFIRDCGRTDLPTGDTSQMFESLQRYRQFPASSRVFPGHHYRPEWWSQLSVEWGQSPPFACKTVQELSDLP